VKSAYERDSTLLRFLDDRGIRPGARVRVLERNYDQTVTLVTEKDKVSVGGPAAEKVWVARSKSGKSRKR
jgi:hypothetical protein